MKPLIKDLIWLVLAIALLIIQMAGIACVMKYFRMWPDGFLVALFGGLVLGMWLIFKIRRAKMSDAEKRHYDTAPIRDDEQ